MGQKAERSRLVRREDIALFTEISGDRNPLHYDEEAARASRFGEIVVQGGVTSAILNAVVAEDLPGPGPCSSTSTGSSRRRCGPATRSPAPSRCSRSREDKPVTKLATSVRRQDGVVVLEGTAVCYTMDLGPNRQPVRRTADPARGGGAVRA